jgi:hypothetical protein
MSVWHQTPKKVLGQTVMPTSDDQIENQDAVLISPADQLC